MKKNSLLVQRELFFATASIAAHFNACIEEGTGAFRLRDVKFLLELFSNWVESGMQEYVLSVQNTQIARYLSDLTAEGYARKISRQKLPSFRLTRTGLIELTARLVNRPYYYERENFFFLYYFIRNYKPRLEKLVRLEGREYPPALRIELESLLDEKALLERESAAARKELLKIEERIVAAKATSKLMQDEAKDGASLNDRIAKAEKKYPYELNSQKPLSELMAKIPERYRLWELHEGNLLRSAQIWEPAREMLECYLGELKKLD